MLIKEYNKIFTNVSNENKKKWLKGKLAWIRLFSGV